jgi:hypothetical protein
MVNVVVKKLKKKKLIHQKKNKTYFIKSKKQRTVICTPNPGQKQERGIFHEIHSKIQT